MKKTIYFIRTAPYDYQERSKTLYESFDLVATRIKDPSLNTHAKDHFLKNIDSRYFLSADIYCSPTLRSQQTAAFVGKEYATLPELYEINYSMSDFINESEFFSNGSNPNVTKARKAFVNALLEGKTQEKFKSVIKRIKVLLQIIQTKESQKVVVFTHGFFMKVIEAYIRNAEIEKNYLLLLDYFSGDSETFKFCEGFKVVEEKTNLLVKDYIRNIYEYRK